MRWGHRSVKHLHSPTFPSRHSTRSRPRSVTCDHAKGRFIPSLREAARRGFPLLTEAVAGTRLGGLGGLQIPLERHGVPLAPPVELVRGRCLHGRAGDGVGRGRHREWPRCEHPVQARRRVDIVCDADELLLRGSQRIGPVGASFVDPNVQVSLSGASHLWAAAGHNALGDGMWKAQERRQRSAACAKASDHCVLTMPRQAS
jgi:hypothetical protein